MRKVDAGVEEDVKGVVQAAVERWGRLDVFFANAGIGGTPKRVFEMQGDSEESFMRTMKVNALRYPSPPLLTSSNKQQDTNDRFQRLPSNQTRLSRNAKKQPPSKRLHNSNSKRSRPTLQRRAHRLLSFKSGRDLHSPNLSLPTQRHEYSLQRHLPGDNRDRDDERDV